MAKPFKASIEGITKEQLLLQPQEQVAALRQKKPKFSIGIPKETNLNEKRISLRPEAVAVLVNAGHEVFIESKAGIGAKFEDHEYSEAGAQIVYHAKEAFAADIVIKIEAPHIEELEYMQPGKTLISTLPLASLTPEYLKLIAKQKIIGIAFELMQDPSGMRPIVRAMSEIAGSTVMLIAAEYLSSENNGKGIILGGITGVPPTKVVIIGAGTVAEYAARTAIGLGAEVKIFDRTIYRLQRIKYAVGQHVFTSTLDPILLEEAISRADLVVGALRPEQGRSAMVVTEEMVAQMRPNSVMIDVSIDQGGCFETSEMTSHKNPVYKKYDVIQYAVPNIASRVARTSSTALSNIFASYLKEIGAFEVVDEMIFRNNWFMKGVYMYKGSLTNIHFAQKFNLPFKDLALLMAARI